MEEAASVSPAVVGGLSAAEEAANVGGYRVVEGHSETQRFGFWVLGFGFWFLGFGYKVCVG